MFDKSFLSNAEKTRYCNSEMNGNTRFTAGYFDNGIYRKKGSAVIYNGSIGVGRTLPTAAERWAKMRRMSVTAYPTPRERKRK